MKNSHHSVIVTAGFWINSRNTFPRNTVLDMEVKGLNHVILPDDVYQPPQGVGDQEL